MATRLSITRNYFPKLLPLTHILPARSRRPSSSLSLSHLQSELKSRRLPLLHDDCSPTPSHLLSLTLADFLPPSPISNTDLRTHSHHRDCPLPFAHHLVYFPPAIPLSSLLPDGTDPLQSPGPPFSRRMWAGGTINFLGGANRIRTGAGPARCLERIRGVTFKGRAGEEKAYVQIERRVYQGPLPASTSDSAEIIPPSSADFTELRNLVFMRSDAPPSPIPTDSSPLSPPPLARPKPAARTPDISHTLTPTPALLFRFSALTFNAHAIHLDKQYCLSHEGHRNLLVHGPLTVLLMTELLRGYLANTTNFNPEAQNREGGRKEKEEQEQIRSIEYRNLAPLYAEEEMRMCGKRGAGEGEWELWIEGGDGRVAVRGRARTGRGVV